MVRKLKESANKSTSERVKEHRIRAKEAGLKRLDLNISHEAFESLKSWSNSNGLTYSEAAEQLFLAATTPLNTYMSAKVSADFPEVFLSGSVSLNSAPQSYDITPIEAFFNNQLKSKGDSNE